ncbi:MAG: hypothetical protein ACI3Y5_03050 [Prevotella sp.]
MFFLLKSIIGIILFIALFFLILILVVLVRFGSFINILRKGRNFPQSDNPFSANANNPSDRKNTISGMGESTRKDDKDRGEYAQFEEID